MNSSYSYRGMFFFIYSDLIDLSSNWLLFYCPDGFYSMFSEEGKPFSFYSCCCWRNSSYFMAVNSFLIYPKAELKLALNSEKSTGTKTRVWATARSPSPTPVTLLTWGFFMPWSLSLSRYIRTQWWIINFFVSWGSAWPA